MSQTSVPSLPQGAPAGRLGVIDAISQGYGLLSVDFWPLWVMAFLAWSITHFAGPAAIVVGPPMAAGLYWALALRMRGQKTEIGAVFQGFSKRFKQSFIAGLVPYGVQMAVTVIWLPVHIIIMLSFAGVMSAAEGGHGEEDLLLAVPGLFCCDYAVLGVLTLTGLVAKGLFVFAQCAVWNFPASGWEAAKFSVRLVLANIWPLIGLFLLFWLIYMLAAIAGLIACCIGVWFTMPLADLWFSATLLHLYESWTGRQVAEATPAA